MDELKLDDAQLNTRSSNSAVDLISGKSVLSNPIYVSSIYVFSHGA
jgi:hypothetical protein